MQRYDFMSNHVSFSNRFWVSILDNPHRVYRLRLNFGTFDMGNITTFSSAFYGCAQLTTILGTLSNIKLNISFSSSPLTEASAMVIINGLADLTGGTSRTLTLSSTTKALLTDADKLIATNKNWTIA
jgi:hypothetical protein